MSPRPILAGLLAVFATSARADFVNVGSIVLDNYSDFNNGQKAGANFTIHYELSDAFNQQDCIGRDSLRWIQLLRLNKTVMFGDTSTPDPNRPFIDPRKDQFVPGAPGDKGDDQPFYDLTYPTAADVGKNDKVIVNGSGAYLLDQPRIGLGARPFSFTAVTLLVSIHPDQQLYVLGGVRWGFGVADDVLGSVTLRGPEYVAGNSALITPFNRALAQDFPGWVIKLPKDLCPDEQPAVSLRTTPVPALPAGVLAVIGGVILLVRREKTAATGGDREGTGQRHREAPMGKGRGQITRPERGRLRSTPAPGSMQRSWPAASPAARSPPGRCRRAGLRTGTVRAGCPRPASSPRAR